MKTKHGYRIIQDTHVDKPKEDYNWRVEIAETSVLLDNHVILSKSNVCNLQSRLINGDGDCHVYKAVVPGSKVWCVEAHLVGANDGHASNIHVHSLQLLSKHDNIAIMYYYIIWNKMEHYSITAKQLAH